MWCQKRELTEYVKRKYIARNQIYEGIEFLLKALAQKSKYRKELLFHQNSTYYLNSADRINILPDRIGFHSVNWSLLGLLELIEKEERPLIFVRKIPEVENNIPNLIPGNNPKSYPGEKKSERKKYNSRQSKLFPPSYYKIGGTIIFLFLLIILFAYINKQRTPSNNLFDPTVGEIESSQTNNYKPLKNENENVLPSPLDQITTWRKDVFAEKWAVWLRGGCPDLDCARKEQRIFTKREIEIIRLNNGRFYLFIFADSRADAEKKQDAAVKKKWRQSRVIPLNKCHLYWDVESEYYICN